MSDPSRRYILERRAAFLATAFVVVGPCARCARDDGPPEIEEQVAPQPLQPKLCLAYPRKPLPGDEESTDAGALDAKADA